MLGADLTHKGSWLAWASCVMFCIITMLSILYADELFYWKLSFSIRDYEKAEPSDWEITSRYVVWTVFSLLIMQLFYMGLQ